MFVFEEKKNFEKHELEELFTSVGWDASNSKILIKAFKKSSHVFACYENNKLIGIIRSLDDSIWNANIDCLVVHKDYQRKGVGSLLIQYLLNELKDIKYITVCPDQIEMFPFYESHGFKRINGLYLQKINSKDS